MRILYVTAAMPYGRGETFLIDEIKELRKRHEVLVVPRSPEALGPHAMWLASHTIQEPLISRRVISRAIRVFARTPERVIRSIRVLMQSRGLDTTLRNLAVFPKALWLASIASEWKADHIHCHWAGTTATMAMIASEVSGVPWSFTAHRFDIVSNNLLTEKVESATLARTIAEEGRRMIIARGVSPDPKLRVLPMGIRMPETFQWKRPSSAVVLCPANLLPVKGHSVLIEAWKTLRDQGIEAQLWLAGEGELRRRLEALVNELGIDESVFFLGEVGHDELLGWYQQGIVSAVALASLDLGSGLHEGVPVALVEAMSYGIPVIATSTGAIPELVRPGTGLLVPPENPSALARAIEHVLEDETFARALAEAAREWVVQTRDIGRLTLELESLMRGDAAPVRAAEIATSTKSHA